MYRHLDSSDAGVPVKFQNCRTILDTISWQWDFTTSYSKASYRILKRGPDLHPMLPPGMTRNGCLGRNLCSFTMDSTSILTARMQCGMFFICFCPACRTSLIATRFWVVVTCPIIKCLTVLEFSFILLNLCLFITIFNFILNFVPIVTFWIFTYH